jgi:steroid delta-isomerase-like uncharacterized protein
MNSRASLAMAIFLAGPAQAALSQTNGGQEKMNLEQNKAIVRSYLDEIVNKKNMAALDSYISEDAIFNNARGFKQRFPAIMQAILSAFPDHHLTIQDQVAEADKVVTRVIFRGTHQGPFNGIAATGKPVEWSGIAIDRLADGKVVEMWHLQNTAGLLQQIAAPPSADPGK